MSIIIGSQYYPWSQLYGERGLNVNDHLDEVFETLVSAGIEAYETTLWSEDDVELHGKHLRKHGLKMPSTYVGGVLHTDDWEANLKGMLKQAGYAKELGATIVVSNPDPLDWSGKTAKTDDQLRIQGKAMHAFDEELRAQGQTLAYHYHTPEFLHAAREVHHMLRAAPKMGVCLDTHWTYRGAGNSQVALEDMTALVAGRVVSLHLRQSHGGVWSEAVEEGDIDHAPIASLLKAAGFEGPAIIEAAFEDGTPRTLGMKEALSRSRAFIQKVFGSR